MTFRFLFFGCCLVGLLACGPEVPPLVDQTLEDVRTQFAPDKRVALFQVAATPGNPVVLKGETNLEMAKAQLLERLKDAGVSYTDSITVLPTAALAGQDRGIVHLSVANIRSKPKHSSELSTQALLGSVLRVYKKQGDWYLVQTPDDYFGWIDAGGFTLVNRDQLQFWKDLPKVIYTKAYGFAYSQPDRKSMPVSDLIAGNIMGVLDDSGPMLRVYFADGRNGYVPKEETQSYFSWKNYPNNGPDKLVATAMSFLGRPYLWGGTSGKGMDCSGFTKTVYFLNGMILPRDASQQVHCGIEIETDPNTLENLLPGDFLFCRNATAEEKEKITHVAIYLGAGRIIHATGMVKIESLRPGDPGFAEDRLKTFIRAKRMSAQLNQHGVVSVDKSEWY